MSNGIRFTDAELAQIVHERLDGLLPTQLTKVAWRYGSPDFTFSAFTGKEKKPEEPHRPWERPALAYRYDDKEKGRPEADEREYDLRDLGRSLLFDAWRRAEDLWSDAAWVVALEKAFQRPEYGDPIGIRWNAYREAQIWLDEAFAALDKLVDSGAGAWASGVSRLVKAQEYALEKAADFDDAAEHIAKIDKEYGYRENSMPSYQAHEKAGGPAAKEWNIGDLDDYSRNWGGKPPVTQTVEKQIQEQDKHVKRVSSLLGQ